MGSRDEQAANANVLGVYLPRLQNMILQPVSNSQPTMIAVPAQAAPDLTPQQQQYLTLEVQPNSAMGADGKPMTNAQVGVSTVPTVLIRDMLPAGVQDPRITITVQAPGVATFSTPIAVTYPNVYNDPPGTKLNFISFDHTTGRLEIEGTATVSADGQSVVTDPGVGITHPGWHFVISGTPAEFQVGVDATQNCGTGEDAQTSNHLLTIIDTALSLLDPTYVPIEPILQANVVAFASIGAQLNGGSALVTAPFYLRFISGIDGVDTEGPDSTLSQEARVDPAFSPVFTQFRDQAQSLIDNEVQAEADTGHIDGNQVGAALSNSNLTPSTPVLNSKDLGIVVHGTQGASLEIHDFHSPSA
jgi:hypothetical protein